MRLHRIPLTAGGLCALFAAACTPDETQAPEELDIEIEAAVAPTLGLVGEWKLDEASGTIAVDSKNGYNATVAGGATFLGAKIGNGLNLNNGTTGTGGKYAEMPSNATLDNVQENNYTLSAWFYPYSIPPSDSVGNHHWAIVLKVGFHEGLALQHDGLFSMRHYLAGNFLRNARSSAPATLNTWHHLAGVVDRTAGTVTLYVNGAAAGSATFPADSAAREFHSTRWRIGKGAANWAADGRVDQVRIYNRALSATEVADLFNETTTTGPTVTTNPATLIKTTSATLNGSANPNGATTTGWFRYSTTNPGSCNDSFGTRTPATGGTALGAGTTAVAYTRALTNLIGGTRYYFCAIASNSGGTRVGTTVQSFIAGSNALRVGMFGMQGRVGQGPGANTTPPIYKFLHINELLPGVRTAIAQADQDDIVLLVAPSRSRGAWTNADGTYNPALYEAEVRKFENDTMFRRAVEQRRVLLYVVDEPHIASFQCSFTPELTNQAALLHKEIWPTGLTFVRLTPTRMRDRWCNQPAPANGWTGVDYAWSQYEAGSAGGRTPAQMIADERVAAAQLNVGVAHSLNLWAGGIKTNLDGVTACWDYDLNSGTPTGYVVGPGTANPPGVTDGQTYSCGNLPTGVPNVMANPNWIRRWADAISTDSELPFALMWSWPNPGTGIEDWALNYVNRSDIVAALDHALNTGNARASWSGYRAPK